MPPLPGSGDFTEKSRVALYAMLVRQMRDRAVFLLDRGGRIQSWNPGVKYLLDYDEEEWIGQPLAMLFTPEDRKRGEVERELQRAAGEGQAADVRWHLKKDQSRVFIDGLLVALKDETGNLLGFARVLQDATDRELHERRLEELTHALKQAQTMMRSLDGTIRFWSQGCERIYLYSKEEALGKISYELLQTEFPKPLEELMAELGEHGTWHGELRHRRKDGSVMITATDWVLHHGMEEPVVVIDASTDITERMHFEQERESLLFQLRRSNEDLSQFSHVVSHDLQEPLRMVKSFTELLVQRYRGKLDETADDFMQIILEGAETMEQLIQSLLEYAQVGKDKAALKPVKLTAVLDAVLTSLQRMLQENAANLTYSRDLPAILGDRVQLQQLFQNLISNAIKYRQEEAPRIEISSERKPDAWVICVRDNGMGILAKDYDRIFKPLERLHGRAIPGTGIGLALCSKIVERHRGRIWVESELGKGSTFFLSFPR
jgi:PAS domain S-box-containing protein